MQAAIFKRMNDSDRNFDTECSINTAHLLQTARLRIISFSFYFFFLKKQILRYRDNFLPRETESNA